MYYEPGICKLAICYITFKCSCIIAESIFKSLWLACPAEWEQPELCKKMELLRSIISLSNKAIEKARFSKFIRSSLEAEVTIRTSSEPILSELMKFSQQSDGDLEFSLGEYFIVSKVNVSGEEIGKGCKDDGNFSVAETVMWHGKENAVEVVAGRVSKTFGLDKCPRCWKWTCPEGEELCGRCATVESSTFEHTQKIV